MTKGQQSECKTGPKTVQERLLDAAEELFCEKGYEATSVRDLAASAECNVASVNYYFGGKEKLYAEVWRRHLAPMRADRIRSIEAAMRGTGGEPELEDLLRAFAGSLTGPVMDMHKDGRFAKLMGREMLDRHLPGSLMLDELVKPTMGSLGEALMTICPGMERSRVPLVILSFVGQLMHALHFRSMMDDVGDEELLDFDMEEVIDHIVKFSAAGIRAYCGETVK